MARFVFEGLEETAGEPPRGRRFVFEGAAEATPPSQTPPDRQSIVQPPRKSENLFQGVRDFVTGENRAEKGVGEIAYQSVPIQTPADPARPRTWFDDLGRSAAIGLGFFLNPNETARAQIIKKQIPTSEFRRDAYGNLQVRYRPNSPWAYVNRPGLSGEDLQTFGNEAMKFLAASKLPGFKAGPKEGLLTQSARAGVTGAATSAAGQAASMPLGAEEISGGDVGVSAVGAAAGQAIGQAVSGAVKATPKVASTVAREVGDRLPGGAQRAAERAAQATAAQSAAEQAARENAEMIVRANAAQLGLVGEALEAEVREASERAAAAISGLYSRQPANELDQLARSFGVRLSRAQTTGDVEGMRFMYEAAAGLHGPPAQRAAAAFIRAQYSALPQGIRAIAGDVTVPNPQAGVSIARTGLERRQAAAKEAEGAAWDEFAQAVPKVRTYDVTPKKRPGAGKFVRERLENALVSDKKMIRAESGRAEFLPEFEATYPRVARVMKLANAMADSTKTEMPLRDVDRVLQLKRFIDANWEAADRAEQRVLTMMGAEVRNWLKESGGKYVPTRSGGPGDAARTLGARGANVTQSALQRALGISAENAKAFRENPLIAEMLDPSRGLTDDEIARRLFGGGRTGLSVSGQSLQALRAMKQTFGQASPEWEALRAAALLRLTNGLGPQGAVISGQAADAVAMAETPAIITTFRAIDNAFKANREAMEVLFTPAELARLREAQRIVGAMAPTPRSEINPSGSGIVTGRALNRAMDLLTSVLKRVPAANVVAGGLEDASAAVRVNAQTQGAPSQASTEIADALRSLWFGDGQAAGAAGAGYGAVAAQDGAYP